MKIYTLKFLALSVLCLNLTAAFSAPSPKNIIASPTISYTPSTNVYTAGVAISTLTPASTNVGALSSYTSANFGLGYSNPEDIAFDVPGNVYVTNIGYNTISKFNASGVLTGTLGTGLNQPYNLSFDAASNAYITNYGTNAVIKVTSGGVQSTLITGAATPFGSVVDALGNIYLASYSNSLIYKYNSAGTLLASLSTPSPTDVALDASGNIYALSYGNGTVTKYNSAGVMQATISTGLTHLSALL